MDHTNAQITPANNVASKAHQCISVTRVNKDAMPLLNNLKYPTITELD